MITFTDIWNKIVGLTKTADIISQIDPMRRVESAHPVYQRVFNMFFQLLPHPEEASVSKYRLRQLHPEGTSAKNTQVRFNLEDFSVRITLYETDILVFFPDHFEVDNGGWGSKATVRHLNFWASRLGLPFTAKFSFIREAPQNGSIFLMAKNDLVYKMDSGIVMMDYSTGQSSNYQPYTGKLRHSARLTFADSKAERKRDILDMLEDLRKRNQQDTAGYIDLKKELDKLKGVKPIPKESNIRFGDILTQLAPEDYHEYLENITQAHPQYQEPEELTDIEESEEAPPSTVSQEHYPRMTPSQMTEAHNVKTQGWQKFVARKKFEVNRDNTVSAAYEKEAANYAEGHGWEILMDNSDYEHPQLVYAKKFADGIHIVQLEGIATNDQPLTDEGIEEIKYDSSSWDMPWKDIFENKDIVESLMDERGYTEYDEIDPMEYISWLLYEGDYGAEHVYETGEGAYRNIIKFMYHDDEHDDPFDERDFYPPAHWPQPKEKPDPNQYSLVNPEGEVLREPQTEKQLRPNIYTELTFDFVKTGDILSQLHQEINEGDKVRIVAERSLGGFKTDNLSAYPVQSVVTLGYIRNVIRDSPRSEKIAKLPDDTKVFMVDFSYFLESDLQVIESKTADIVSQPSLQPEGQMPNQSTSDTAVLVYFYGGSHLKGTYETKDLSRINQVAMQTGHSGYLKGKRYSYFHGVEQPVIVYFDAQPDAAEIQRRRTNGFLGARWHALPVEPLVNPTASLKFSDIVDAFRGLGQEPIRRTEEDENTETEEDDSHREVYIASAGTAVIGQTWGIFDTDDDSWITTTPDRESAIRWINRHPNWEWSEGEIPERYLRAEREHETPAPVMEEQPIREQLQWIPLIDAYEQMQPNEVWTVRRRDTDDSKSWTIVENNVTVTGRKLKIQVDGARRTVTTPKQREELYEAQKVETQQVQASSEDTMEILSVNGPYIPKGGYMPYIRIRFTPVQVYGHVSGYSKLQRAIFDMMKPYRKYVSSYDTERLAGSGFKDRGMIINFKTEKATPDILQQAATDLQGLIGSSYPLGTESSITFSDTSMMKESDWTAYLSAQTFDVDRFWQYARPNQVWSFQRVGQGQFQGTSINRFVKIARLNSELGQVHGTFGGSLEEVMYSEKDAATGFPIDDGWTNMRFVQQISIPKEIGI